MTGFPKNIEISYSNNSRFRFVCFHYIKFVHRPSSFIKSLNENNLIEINLQTDCQNLETLLLYDTEYKNVKNFR